ncbi:MAG: tRNA 2-thiouridine(34) synthase MnmA, partial [Armatimonadota bacterium]
MSGGVDSSVAAALLLQRGYQVIGVTMQIWQQSQTDPRHAGCCSLGAVEDARRVARALGIPYYVLNFREEFRRLVIEDFLNEYAQGRTPNPCLECNRSIKFDHLMKKADEIGCSLLATGHYARTRFDKRYRRWRLLRAKAASKDQSYALYMLDQVTLARVRFPLGELPDKAETRAIARDLGLPVAEKPDSQEICFVSEAGGYREFLCATRPSAVKEGEIVDTRGRVLGTHAGVAHYTIGQRKGLRLNIDGRPLYVLQVEPQSNRVVVGSDDGLFTREVRFLDELRSVERRTRVEGKIRYNMSPARATLYPGDVARVVFD